MSIMTIMGASAQIGSEATSVAIPWVRIAFAFAFCILVAVGAIALLRVRQGRWDAGDLRSLLKGGLPDGLTRARRLIMIERLPLAPGHHAVLLRCDNRDLLLHIAPQGATLIADLIAKDASSS